MAGEVLADPEPRRRWSVEERAEIVSEMASPGANVSDIARRRGIRRSLLRRELYICHRQPVSRLLATPALLDRKTVTCLVLPDGLSKIRRAPVANTVRNAVKRFGLDMLRER